MKVDEILKNVTEEIANMISTKTVIGDALTIQGKTIIPVTSVSFGFGSGGVVRAGKRMVRKVSEAAGAEVLSLNPWLSLWYQRKM
ncbi:MAG: spore germination protein GerW family protein [Candidatus Methanoperedens sp.]|nr:spore germination protein GerW family protein [Candidatus Methanoperedens sp.]